MTQTNKARVKTIPVDAIKISGRTRTYFGNADDKEGIKNSIKDFGGVLTPITVEENEAGSYNLLAGERRLTYVKELGFPTIEAKIFPKLSPTQRLEAEFGENFYRLNWTLEERLELTKRIHEAHQAEHGEALSGGSSGWSTSNTATVMGRTQSTVSRDLTAARYLEIAPELAKEGSSDKIIKAGKKLIQKHDNEKRAEKIEARKVETPRETRVKQLCDQFFIVPKHEDVLRSGAAGAITELDSESVDFINFDPPYGIDHGNNNKRRDSEDDQIKIYNEIPPETYPQWISHMLKHCYRVLKPNSFLVLWFAPEPWTAYKTTYKVKVGGKTVERTFFENLVIKWLYEAGFDRIRAMPAQWYGYNGQTIQYEIYLANDHELFYYVAKGNPRLYRSWFATFPYRKVPLQRRWHLLQRPVALSYNITNVFCAPGSTILSPCLGSGADILGADDHNCKCFGWEVEKEYRTSFVNFVDKNLVEGKKWSNIPYEEYKL